MDSPTSIRIVIVIDVHRNDFCRQRSGRWIRCLHRTSFLVFDHNRIDAIDEFSIANTKSISIQHAANNDDNDDAHTPRCDP
jgi:hypothetical protein